MSHTTVLKEESVNFLDIKPGGIYIDATFGAGGHSREILKRCANITLICIDRDENVRQFFDILSADFPHSNLIFINDLFGNIVKVLEKINILSIDGLIADFGVSSMQIDNCERGFSFQAEAPLSMEMGINQQSAFDIINEMPENALANIIYKYGDERKSRFIAKKIVENRKIETIKTTMQLANIVKKAVGKYNDTIHPATRTFQAIRIFVNQELSEIESLMGSISKISRIGSRFSFISFHSLEDIIVKDFVKKHLEIQRDNFDKNYGMIEEKESNTSPNRLVVLPLHRKVIAPSNLEVKSNIRSRSAKLRSFEIINF